MSAATEKKDVTGLACGVRPVRRVVHCDGVRGVLVRRESGWVLDNEREVQMLAALGDSRAAFGRLRALAATLNAGLIELSEMSRLNRLIVALAAADAEKLHRVRVPDQFVPALAFVCAHMAHWNGSSWLAWTLSARLRGNLRVDGGLPGPGWQSWNTPHTFGHRFYWGPGDCDIRWVDEMPSAFWDRLNAHDEPWLRDVAVASDPSTRPGVLKELVQPRMGGKEGVRIPRRWRYIHDAWDREVLDLVASHPNTQPKVLVRMAKDNRMDWSLQYRVAQNKSASRWVLQRLAKHPIPDVRGIVAAHPKMPSLTLAKLCADYYKHVRAAVARNRNTPEQALRELARDDESVVRCAVAWNASAPVEVLEMLLSDRISKVRRGAVCNPSTPVELVVPLAGDRAMGVRRMVAGNTKIPGDVLEKLARDPKSRVRSAAAYNESTPAVVLESLASDPEIGVRCSVAHNAAAPAVVLESLASDPEAAVIASVARNAAAPAAVLEALASDPDSWIRDMVAENTSAPVAVLEVLATDPDSYWVRGAVATNAAAPAVVLEALAADRDAWVRARVPDNPAVTAEVLTMLVGDGHCSVRANAKKALKDRKESQEEGKG